MNEIVLKHFDLVDSDILNAGCKEIYRQGRRASVDIDRLYAGDMLRASRSAIRMPTTYLPVNFPQLLLSELPSARDAVMPGSWIEEGVEPPTSEVVSNADRFILSTYQTRRLVPIRVSCSRVGGIMVAYRDPSTCRDLDVEFDNEGDVCAVLATDKEVVQSAVVDDPVDLDELFRAFAS